ncbi:DUF5722 domain-containing protein [Paenibacillus mendelii]|uniref:DUF5722 domain-containing protein n=1 Tax=Paenibacillus mendelii TaxID=206163 RepID=A0ABV6J235_9BACL|nr:DUF5722 domain-containing protein [Paenibacillus mendelii]MCQ6562867.1 DUF5722 domain-containing protein [Paenibacillus mendelii]
MMSLIQRGCGAWLAAVLLVTAWTGGAGAAAASVSEHLEQTSNMRTVDLFHPYRVIDDFETNESLANWQAGEHTQSVSRVNSELNVFAADQGLYFLTAKSELNLQNNVWRTVYREFAEPLDLSESRYIMMAFAHYGYLPNDMPYLVRIRAYSGTSFEEGIVRTTENKWNRIGLMIGEWAGRNSIDKLEISWQHAYDRAVDPFPGGDPLPYWPDPKFQVDYVHAANDLGWQFQYPGDAEGWTGNDSTLPLTTQNGRLSIPVTGTGAGAAITSNVTRIDASSQNVVLLKLRNQSANTQGLLSWTTEADPVFSPSKSQTFQLVASDGETRTYAIRLAAQPLWTGEVNRLRISLTDNPGTAGSLELEEIALDRDDRPPVEYIGSVSEVSVGEDLITLKGTASPPGTAAGTKLALYELAPYEHEANTSSLAPAAVQDASSSGGAFTFSIPRYDGERDRYYSKFLVAELDPDSSVPPRYVDAPKYATDITFDARHQYSYPTAHSKKGLQVMMSDDAEELGAAHAAVNVVLTGLMYKGNSNPSNTIAYSMDGETYYFQKGYVESLDRQIKPLSDNGTIVNLVLILYASQDPNTMTDVLMHPDADPSQGGTVFAFNTANEAGVKAFRAAMEFIADRYTREDEKYGRAVGYIVGNEVDAQWEWQNMGEKSVRQFIEQYEPAVRIAYLAARKYYDHARVYVSLTNNWTKPAGGNPMRYYKAREIIDLMNEQANHGGNYPWHVAFHPYPEDFFNADPWNDERAIDSADSPQITFKNLHVLNDYMKRNELLLNGSPRRIILSEQGIHTADGSEAAAKQQAAAFAYAYYKTLFLPGIDSFIWFSHIDIPSAGLNMGLWTQDPEKTVPFTPKGKKFIYDVFRDIDTERSLEAAAFAKPIIGIEEWQDVITGFDPNALAVRNLQERSPIRFVSDSGPHSQGDSFESGTDGWEPADNVMSAVQSSGDAYEGTGALETAFSDLALKWRGVSKRLASPYDAGDHPYLRLAVKLTGTSPGTPYYVKLKVYSGTDWTEGVVRVDPEQGWIPLSLDLSGWSKRHSIDRLKIGAVSSGNRTWSGKVLVDDVGFTGAPLTRPGNYDALATLMESAPAPGGAMTVRITNYDSEPMQGTVELAGHNGMVLDKSALDVNGIAFGETRSYPLTITELHSVPGAKPGIRFSYMGQTLDQTFDSGKPTGENQLPSFEKLLYNFEAATLGWTGAEHVDEVKSVDRIANAPFGPALGAYVLEASFPTMAADTWRTVSVTPEQPLDLTEADAIFLHVNSYGGSGGTGYETRLRLRSGDHVLENIIQTRADAWNRVEADISGWPYRNNVQSMEVSFRAVGTSEPWYGSRFQLDYIGLVRHDNVEDPADLEEMVMQPFWQGERMVNESVLMMSRDGEPAEASLLFEPIRVESVMSARLDMEYVEGIDWVLEDGKLKLTPNTRIPYMADTEMYLPEYIPNVSMPRNGGGGVIFREGSFFHDRQIVVTYTHESDAWKGPTPLYADTALPRTTDRLKNGEPIRFVLYGDSISVGANASGFTQVPPYLPVWGQLAAQELERRHGSDITFINPSVGGTTSSWGVEQAKTLVADQQPDLVIIAFGMNDGSGTGRGDGTEPALFKQNIATIIQTVRADNPDAEFILVGTTLPNSETFFFGKHPLYYPVLSELAGELSGVAAADITGVHAELLKKKAFHDMTGNNINHPNDFLSRWYAQFVVGMLSLPEENPPVEGQPGKPVLSHNNGHDTGLQDGDYTITMNMWWGNNGTSYKLFENGREIHRRSLVPSTPTAQAASFEVKGRMNGTYVYTCELTNSAGTTSCEPITVVVTDANPGKPVLASDNWDQDGNYQVKMNMWWGSNGHTYRLYENGILVEEKPIAMKTPGSQSTITPFTGKQPGSYLYRAELINDNGVTESEELTVTVR